MTMAAGDAAVAERSCVIVAVSHGPCSMSSTRKSSPSRQSISATNGQGNHSPAPTTGSPWASLAFTEAPLRPNKWD